MDERTYFAGLALQALISKLPLMDREGEVGMLKTDEEQQEIKKGIADSAWIYADWMLFMKNKEH